jgi:hypothetical protein
MHHCEAGNTRTLKFVFTGGGVHVGPTLFEQSPSNTLLKSPGSARPTSGSAYRL